MESLSARTVNWLVVCWGWRRRMAALALGAVLSLTMAPLFLLPALFVALTGLVFLLDGAVLGADDGRQRGFWPGFSVGWWFGFGYFLAGLWWIGGAFLVEADRFGWLLPIAIAVLPAGLALFWGVGLGLARLAWTSGAGRLVAIVGGLVLAEWSRATLFTGFPWNTLGLAVAPHPLLMQSASVIGMDGLTLLAAILGVAPAAVLHDRTAKRQSRSERWFVSIAIGLACLHIGYGATRLAISEVQTFDGVALRIVQPSIPQAEKWVPENRGRIFGSYLELSDRAITPDRPGLSAVTHLIWPETAFPFLLLEEPGALAALAALLPDHTMLLSGAARRDPTAPTAASGFYNSIYAIDGKGQILAAYDKVHLVPFGEYLPLQSALEAIGLEQLTRIKGGFLSGPGYRSISTLAGTPGFLPLICYEILFSHEGRAAAREASWILNVTNDAWFGDTPGPRQHLHASQLRSVLDGLAVVRAANTGISAVIDPYGRVLDRLPVNAVGVIDSPLPQPLSAPPLASSLPAWSGLLLAVLALGWATVMRRAASFRQ